MPESTRIDRRINEVQYQIDYYRDALKDLGKKMSDLRMERIMANLHKEE